MDNITEDDNYRSDVEIDSEAEEVVKNNENSSDEINFSDDEVGQGVVDNVDTTGDLRLSLPRISSTQLERLFEGKSNVIPEFIKYSNRSLDKIRGRFVSAEEIIPFLPIGYEFDDLSEIKMRETQIRALPEPEECEPDHRLVMRKKGDRRHQAKEWEVEAVIASAVIDSETEFLVQWFGFPENMNTFERKDTVERTVAFFHFEYPEAETSAGCSGKWCSMTEPNIKAVKISGKYTNTLRQLLDNAKNMKLYDSRVGFFSDDRETTMKLELEFFAILQKRWSRLPEGIHIGTKVIGHSSELVRELATIQEIKKHYVSTVSTILKYVRPLTANNLMSIFLIISPLGSRHSGHRVHANVLFVTNEDLLGTKQYFLFDSMDKGAARNNMPQMLEVALANIGQPSYSTKEYRIAFGSQECDNDCLERCLVLIANYLDKPLVLKELEWFGPFPLYTHGH